jgi:hypothetical protein
MQSKSKLWQRGRHEHTLSIRLKCKKVEVEEPAKEFAFYTASVFGIVPEIIPEPHQAHSAVVFRTIYAWEAPTFLSMDVRQATIASGSRSGVSLGKSTSFIHHS